jgi:hypothetical protein
MMRSTILALAVTFAMSVPIVSTAANTTTVTNEASGRWLLSYQGKTTNQVRWDPRLPSLLQAGLPDFNVHIYSNQPLPETALTYLSGPPEPVNIESGRYVTLAACVPQVGELKGLLWVDLGGSGHPQMIFAALDQDAGKNFRASLALFTQNDEYAKKLPPQFIASLTSWLTGRGIKQLSGFTIANAQDKLTDLSPGILGSY